MRYSQAVAHERRVLCVFPAYTPSFGTFAHAYKLISGVRAFMPPQGLLVIAAYLPQLRREYAFWMEGAQSVLPGKPH